MTWQALSQVQMAAGNQYSKLGLPETPTLFLEFHGTQAGVAEQVEVKAIFESNLG